MIKVTLLISILCIGSNAAFAEQSLRRLFFSPAERALMDIKDQVVKKTPQAKSAPLPQTETIEVKGYLKRSDQPDVVWINSKNTLKSNRPLADVKVLAVQPGGKVKLNIRGKGVVRLKPAQLVTRSKTAIREAYESK
ncbi:MAG: hypothetical protein OEY29_08475 [Gammaproteobacteria bacterium]|nr:hypothetical protein [Gammaproteobacteria bacterium]